MSAEPEYKCPKCKYEWEAIPPSECPKCQKNRMIPEAQNIALAEACGTADRMKTRINHMYQDRPAKVGSIAECGHVKKTKGGFDEKAPTCSECVKIVIGPRLHRQK